MEIVERAISKKKQYIKHLLIVHAQYSKLASISLSDRWSRFNQTINFCGINDIWATDLEVVSYLVKKFKVPFRVLPPSINSLPVSFFANITLRILFVFF